MNRMDQSAHSSSIKNLGKLLAGILGGTLLVGPVLADCSTPKAPDSIPDGKTAAKEEMIAAMAVYKQYNTDIDAFAECLKTETKTKLSDGSVPSGQMMQFKSMQTRKEASARDELKTRVDKFNEQVRVFKGRS